MTIQWGRSPSEQVSVPQRPSRKNDGHIHKFWMPRGSDTTKFWAPKEPDPNKVINNNNTNNKSEDVSTARGGPTHPLSSVKFLKSKTPQPATTTTTKTSQKKVVSFWNESHYAKNEQTKTSSSLQMTSSRSMINLHKPEVDENRGFTPSEVAKDPAKKEFLINLSKKIFSPSDQQSIKRRRSFRVRVSNEDVPQRRLTEDVPLPSPYPP